MKRNLNNKIALIADICPNIKKAHKPCLNQGLCAFCRNVLLRTFNNLRTKLLKQFYAFY